MELTIMLKKTTTAKFNFVLILMTLVYVKRWENRESGNVIFIIGHLFCMTAVILSCHMKSQKRILKTK